MKTLFLFACFLVSPLSYARPYIIGGQDVGPRDPVRASTVGIFSREPGSASGALCTGTLIGNNMAVTAAHCIEPHVEPEVIFGRDLRSPTAVRETAQAVAVNPKWARRAGRGMDQGDIALVKFGGGLPAGYEQIPTVSSDAAIQKGGTVTLAGYGISNARTKTGAGRLRRANVSILNNRPGKTEMILDQTHGRGACHGDSGGPAFIRQGGQTALAGVTNRGYPGSAPDDCAHQSVYTKIPAYRRWIAQSERRLDRTPDGTQLAHRMKVRVRGTRASHHRLARASRRQAPGLHYARRGRHFGKSRV